VADAVKLRQFRRAIEAALRSHRHASATAYQASKRVNELEQAGKALAATVKDEAFKKAITDRALAFRGAAWDHYLKVDETRFEIYELAELIGAETGE
jgi:hypothetical protein